MSLDNPRSLYVHLNKVGSYFTDLLEVQLPGLANHLVSSRPITIETVAGNLIDDQKSDAMLETGAGTTGLKLVHTQDISMLRELMRHQGYRVVAVARKSISVDGAMLILMPTHPVPAC